MLRTDFAQLEENHTAVQVKVSKFSWLPLLAHFGVVIASTTNSIAAFWVEKHLIA